MCCHVQSFSLRYSEGAKFRMFDSVVFWKGKAFFFFCSMSQTTQPIIIVGRSTEDAFDELEALFFAKTNS